MRAGDPVRIVQVMLKSGKRKYSARWALVRTIPPLEMIIPDPETASRPPAWGVVQKILTTEDRADVLTASKLGVDCGIIGAASTERGAVVLEAAGRLWVCEEPRVVDVARETVVEASGEVLAFGVEVAKAAPLT